MTLETLLDDDAYAVSIDYIQPELLADSWHDEHASAIRMHPFDDAAIL
jgi:hypothetical protein